MHRALEDGRYQQVLDRFDVLEDRLATELAVVPGRAAVALRDEAQRQVALLGMEQAFGLRPDPG